MTDRIVDLTDFTGGIQSRNTNPLTVPQNSLASGQNVEISQGGLKTRPGITRMDAAGLPYGEIMAITQARFPTNETSYIVVQVKELEPPASEWIELASLPDDFYRAEHTAVWDSTAERMLVCGGLRNTGGDTSFLWEYNPATNVWATITPAASEPVWRRGHVAIYDPDGDVMVIHGGYDDTDVLLSDVWTFDYATSTWTEITTSGIGPGATANHAAVYRSTGVGTGEMLSVLGQDQGGSSFRLNLQTWEWTSLTMLGWTYPPFSMVGATQSANSGLWTTLPAATGHGVTVLTGVYVDSSTNYQGWLAVQEVTATSITVDQAYQDETLNTQGRPGSDTTSIQHAAAMSTAVDTVFFVGGEVSDALKNRVHYYDFVDTLFQSSSDLTLPVTTGLTQAAAAPLTSGNVFIVGGRDEDGGTVYEDSCFIVDATLKTIATVSTSAAWDHQRVEHTAVNVGSNRILVFGGTGELGNFGDLWSITISEA